MLNNQLNKLLKMERKEYKNQNQKKVQMIVFKNKIANNKIIINKRNNNNLNNLLTIKKIYLLKIKQLNKFNKQFIKKHKKHANYLE